MIWICNFAANQIDCKMNKDIYYNSETANLIEEGVADLHCRSDKYLAGEVWREYQENHKKDIVNYTKWIIQHPSCY